MSPLRIEIESLLEKDGWTLEKRKKYTYAYKDDESERYRVGDRGIRKQRHTNVGWVNAGKRNLVPLSGVKEYLKGKVKGSEIIHGNPCGVEPQARVNPRETTSSEFSMHDLRELSRSIVGEIVSKYVSTEISAQELFGDIFASVARGESIVGTMIIERTRPGPHNVISGLTPTERTVLFHLIVNELQGFI